MAEQIDKYLNKQGMVIKTFLEIDPFLVTQLLKKNQSKKKKRRKKQTDRIRRCNLFSLVKTPKSIWILLKS